ncbi:MAG: AAA family ATPase, partial [candidate division WOR-3 bacterium]|nr:AAA family ATPase [candidate division WOR-3 bacterium]
MNKHPKELPVEKLRKVCNLNQLDFETTKELEFCEEIVGQKRAVDALQLGLEISSSGYNIFVTGYVGTGRTSTIKTLLDRLEKTRKTPDDMLYVHNFAEPDSPRLIRLPAGKGVQFARAMDELIEHLITNIPLVFESENYQRRRTKLVERFKEKSAALARELERKIQEQNFGLIQTLPIARPELVFIFENQQYNLSGLKSLLEEKKISQEQYEQIRETYFKLLAELDEVFKKIRSIEKETRKVLVELEQEMVKPVVTEQINEIKEQFPFESINNYLTEVEKQVLLNIARFLPRDDKERAPTIEMFTEFRVNVLVDNSKLQGAPVIFENSPTYKNLFGTIERIWDRTGQWRTDLTKIKAGSLLKADGGFLVINALDALLEPGVWPALKRTLRNRVLEISGYDPYAMFSLPSLKPEPIPIDVKVIMIGEPYIYQILYTHDEDFKKIFKVRADFDWVMDLSDETLKQFVVAVKSIAEKEKIRQLDKTAVAALVEHGMRLAGRKDKISTQFNIITDVMKEANFWAEKENLDIISKRHIDKAIEEQIERVSMIEDKIQEMIAKGLIFIDTDGKVIGQVNGLSIYDTGEYSFGRPSRITAKVSVGTAGIINIEREAELSGPIHSKG